MRNVKFLVVDDSAMARKLVAGVIRTKLGANEVLMASDGREALQLLEHNDVDLIVSDWNMTDMHGDELLEHVRKHPKYKNTPFLMVTTNNRRDFIVTALQLGVTQYVIKPFTPMELEQKIRASWSATSKRRSERHADLPPHRAALKLNGKSYAAQLIDMSRNGALARIRYDDGIALYKDYELSMQFEDDALDRQWNIGPLKVTSRRIEADDPAKPSCLFAAEFHIDTLPKETVDELFSLLEYLGSRMPKLINHG
jgi:two-component system chemotaxis response regulator CheY